MSTSNHNPFNDPFNPYAAPQVSGYATENSGEGPALATRGQRFAGAFIDGLLMLPLVFGMLFFVRTAAVPGGAQPEVPLLVTLAFVPVSMAWFLILNGYLLATKGQTIGKLATGTQIVDAQTGQLVPLVPLYLKRNFSLQLLALIPLVGNFIALIDALMIFRASRKCLHDEIAGTKVIVYQPRT
ncbi:MAG: RDD family protein [Planctomycetaceae bacterium]